MFVWPHGIDVDDEGNVWVADARGNESGTKGHSVQKFSATTKPVGNKLHTNAQLHQNYTQRKTAAIKAAVNR